MLEKLFGFINIKECISKINVVKKDYEEKIEQLRTLVNEYDERISRANIEKRLLENKLYSLENENRKLKKENKDLKQKANENRFIGLSNDIAMTYGWWG